MTEIADTSFEALYNLNKHAKRYAGLASDNYQKGKKATAKQNSLKKKALYGLKAEVLGQIKDVAESVVIHEINGSEYYCLYFDDWSYHARIDELSIDDERVTGEESLDNFEKTDEKEHSNMSLKASLQHIQERFGLSANDFLEQERVQYGYNSYFAGWSYLD